MRGRRRLVAEINVVPYIDVSLVLLVIFMVSTPLMMQGLPVDLPKVQSAPLTQKEEPLIVSVKADGSYYLSLGGNPEQPLKLSLVAERVQKVLRANPELQVLVWGDQAVPYGAVVELMSVLQGAGASGVGLVTEEPAPRSS